ncbi:uncharacterized protein LOC114524945 [Dendronephthya gigantea]|uniref:uncharacterized protein LOC114524945 n=1 Tax=Dendronephthya gigantea TaxID=151771 RepID=UPI001069FCB2|nr:uncharacterized protein LOC114524945 [Dendronephthya gigantea]XP_028401992.1 uncharacterized protein LOC114524945 [Dendronephthya gigantea]XP_028401993.1 uncharacterized protein LOC114524945 [Dendronephthya gigantea]XP_028401994.1 uncharacterized protein LOC114524945 [Dendronephthya gigantea]
MRWLSKCCCCVSLRTGGLISGAWTLFTALLMVSLQIVNVISMESLTRYQIKHGEIKLKSTKILATMEIAFGIILFLASLLLSLAVFKERSKLLIPYIIGVLLYEIFDFLSLMFYFGKGVEIDSSVWIPDALVLCINIYCVFVVLSLYKQFVRIERWNHVDQMDSSEY